MKYYLALKIKTFPKTHSLRVLIKGIGKAYQKTEETEKILKENFEVIADLEEASITSRYLPVEFSGGEIKNAFFYRKVN